MSINLRGSDFLIPKEEQRTMWGRKELLTGEANVLRNPLVEKANERILDTFKPRHDTVIFSLCSSTRPYYRSPKWASLVRRFGDRADLVICSNGGVIPMDYAHCWPFMTYDAKRSTSGSFDDEYVEVLGPRLQSFLSRFSYRRVIHLFKDTSRNLRVVEEYGLPGESLPTAQTYGRLREMWSAGEAFYYRMHPHAHPIVLDEIAERIARE